MKALVITSVASMIEQFLYSSVNLLREMGYEVVVACNFSDGNTCNERQINNLKNRLTRDGVDYREISFSRNIKQIGSHIKSYKQVKALLDEGFNIIHCHSPIGGLITRLAIGRDHKEKVIYTAHGFHFYKGAPLLNWLLFFPIEYFASFRTDVLITINKDDYIIAKKRLHSRKTEYIPGVGIDTVKIADNKPSREKREAIKGMLGISNAYTMLLSIGELNRNKNHIAVINALGKIHRDYPQYEWKYVICGIGPLEGFLRREAEKQNISKQVVFAGYREDAWDLIYCADLFIHPSLREGLSVALMEAIACECPVICSDIRGNWDIVDERMLFDPKNVDDIVNLLEPCLNGSHEVHTNYKNRITYNLRKLEKCKISNINEKMKRIYEISG